MRVVLIVLVAVVFSLAGDAAASAVLPAQAGQPPGETSTQREKPARPTVRERHGGITHEVEGGRETETANLTPLSRISGMRPTRPRAPVYYMTFPTFATLPDGTRCVRMIRRAYGSPLAAGIAGDTQNILSTVAADDYPPCPGSPRPATTAATEAATLGRVAGEDLLPKPEPRIAPGYMLAGKRAYLEARTVPAATFTHRTPLGLLTIEATSRDVYVDWGDGAGLRGPYEGPGEPWPEGRITHFWTNAGSYDVRVQQRWAGRWRLASGESGELDALTTRPSSRTSRCASSKPCATADRRGYVRSSRRRGGVMGTAKGMGAS